MKTWYTIQNELTELNSSLSSGKLPEVYTVPEGYFESFAQTVLQKIKSSNTSASEELETLSPLLAGLSRKMPYSVPEGYFNEINTQLPGITLEESLPEILISAGKSMPYKVPVGYFEELPATVLNNVRPARTSAKVISIGLRWMKYAAAAIIAGVMVVSSIFYFGNRNDGTPSVQSEQWIASQLKNVSIEELEAFINTADISSKTLAQNSSNNAEVRSLLNDVPDSELEKFLKDVPLEVYSGMN
jgi:hypothetical protein